jgi:RNA-binding protein
MDVANLSFRAFSLATEDPDRVEKALRFVSGAEDIKRSTSSGYHGNPIIIMEAKITDAKGIKAVFRSLGKQELEKFLDTIDRRIDDDSFFFFRLDKQEAYLGNIRNGDGDDIIAVRAKVKSYPQNRDNALTSMEKFLRSEIDRITRQEAQE